MENPSGKLDGGPDLCFDSLRIFGPEIQRYLPGDLDGRDTLSFVFFLDEVLDQLIGETCRLHDVDRVDKRIIHRIGIEGIVVPGQVGFFFR